MSRCLCVLLTLWAMTAGNDHVSNIEVMYDHPANLTCMTSDYDPSPATDRIEIRWLLPNGDYLEKNQNHERVMLYEDGKHIKIMKVDDIDFGVYNCIIYSYATRNYIVVQKGININGPYWGNLTEKYRTNMIVGAVSAAVVLVLMLGICYFMDRGRNVDRDEERRLHNNDKLWTSGTNGIENAAVELNDVEIQKVAPINGDNPLPVYTTIDTPTELATKM